MKLDNPVGVIKKKDSDKYRSIYSKKSVLT